MKRKAESLFRYFRKLLITIKKLRREAKSISFLCLMLLVFLFNGCEIYDTISFNAAEGVDFSEYKTFAWLPDHADTTNQPYDNEIVRNNIRNYFGQSLAQRGYTTNLESPDLLLKIVVTGKKREGTNVYSTYSYAYPGPYYYNRYYYGSPYHFPYRTSYYYNSYAAYPYPSGYYTAIYTYTESTITLDIFDRKQNKLVWSGTAKGDIYDQSFINRSIHPAVEAIMRKYPVKPLPKKSKPSNALARI